MDHNLPIDLSDPRSERALSIYRETASLYERVNRALGRTSVFVVTSANSQSLTVSHGRTARSTTVQANR